MSEPGNNIASVRARAELISEVIASKDTTPEHFGYLAVEMMLREAAAQLRCAAEMRATPAHLKLMSQVMESLAQDTALLADAMVDKDYPESTD